MIWRRINNRSGTCQHKTPLALDLMKVLRHSYNCTIHDYDNATHDECEETFMTAILLCAWHGILAASDGFLAGWLHGFMALAWVAKIDAYDCYERCAYIYARRTKVLYRDYDASTTFTNSCNKSSTSRQHGHEYKEDMVTGTQPTSCEERNVMIFSVQCAVLYAHRNCFLCTSAQNDINTSCLSFPKPLAATSSISLGILVLDLESSEVGVGLCADFLRC